MYSYINAFKILFCSVISLQNHRKFIFNILETPSVNAVVDINIIVLAGFDFAVVVSAVVIFLLDILVDVCVVVVSNTDVVFGGVVVDILVDAFGVIVVGRDVVFVVLVFVDGVVESAIVGVVDVTGVVVTVDKPATYQRQHFDFNFNTDFLLLVKLSYILFFVVTLVNYFNS